MQPTPLKISSGSEYILFNIWGPLYPDAEDGWDLSWLMVDISIHVSGFSAKFQANLLRDDFVSFRNEMQHLSTVLEGQAKFETMEEQLELNLEGDNKGHILLRGVASDRAGLTGNTLHFAFSNFDQSHLPEIIQQLDNLISQFPVVEKK